MKTILVLAFFTFFFTWEMAAQQPFYPHQEGVVLTYAERNTKGKITGYSRITIAKVEVTDERNFLVTTENEVLDERKKPLLKEPMKVTVQVVDGVVRFAPDSFAGKLAEGMEVSGDSFLLPADISVGDVVKDYTVTVAIGPMKTSSTYTDTKVTGRETLNIGEKAVECYVVESSVLAKVLGIKQESFQKIWYGRGIGQVKMQIYNKKGKLQMTQELVEIDGL